MPVICHLHQLEHQDLHLTGELATEELGLENLDELLHDFSPLIYDLQVQLLDRTVLVRGTLTMDYRAECARCLKPFASRLHLDSWNCLLRLDDEEVTPIQGDSVDLTPLIREDILLTLPQRPLCKNECDGLVSQPQEADVKAHGKDNKPGLSPGWVELNKLKL